MIKEDSTPLFEGDANGLRRYISTVPQQAMALAPQIHLYRIRIQRERWEQNSKISGNNDSADRPMLQFDIPEPFQNFNVEIRFNHPYWQIFEADMSGPRFNNSDPDLDDYIRDYESGSKTMEDLAKALMAVAFPGAGEQVAGASAGMVSGYGAAAPAAPAVDPVVELQRYKALMDSGVITAEEFEIKKRQILGIS